MSYWQYRECAATLCRSHADSSPDPFTLTSAPEEDYLSVHIRVVGDWTVDFAKAVGCNFDFKSEAEERDAVKAPLNVTLPRIMVDGPFGSASEDFAKFETVLLVGAGIGVTPFASILKSIWYRMNGYGREKKARLSKVYFVWVIKTFADAGWFHSLLQAIEAEDREGRIEIHIYLTAKVDEDQIKNILVQDVGSEKDAITALRAPTHFGRPNVSETRAWRLMISLTYQSGTACSKVSHRDILIRIVASCELLRRPYPTFSCSRPSSFCGPAALSKQLHSTSNKYTTPEGCRFFFGKEVRPHRKVMESAFDSLPQNF